MRYYSGLDIGGTKIAGAVFDDHGQELKRIVHTTPKNYSEFVTNCRTIIEELDATCHEHASIGLGVPYAVANMPFLYEMPLKRDLEKLLGRPVRVANDANCVALGEAYDGSGANYASVFGLVLGTGTGGGFVHKNLVVEGINGSAGEVGHLPLPYYEASDGPLVLCGCRQTGCIEKLTCGEALQRLYTMMTGKTIDTVTLSKQAQAKDPEALKVLDRYFTVVAKAMVTILHTFDPEVIVVSGGLNSLPGLYEEVPRRWGRYALSKEPKTKFVPAKYGSMSGVRGAAWLWREIDASQDMVP